MAESQEEHDEETEEETKPPWRVSIFKGALDRGSIILLLGVIVGLGLFGFQRLQPKPYDPLGDYPEQVVGQDGSVPPKQLLPLEQYGIQYLPTLHLKTGNEALPVHGKKCTDSDVPVQVSGEVTWVSTEPPGSSVPANKGTATRVAGCQTFDFNNPIPVPVIERLKQLHDQGISVTKWRLTGKETPIDPDGNQFVVTKTFTSNEFVIVYEMP